MTEPAGVTSPLHGRAQEQVTLFEAGSPPTRAGGADSEPSAGGWTPVRGDVDHGVTAGPSGAGIAAGMVQHGAPGDEAGS